MAYVPNASELTEPTESQTVESAALEFRTLKAAVDSLTTTVDTLSDNSLKVIDVAISPLPDVELRAGKLVGFDASGQPTVLTPGTIGVSINDPNISYDVANGNVKFGLDALGGAGGGFDNVAIGPGALFSADDCSSNVAIGPYALNTNTLGSENIAIGEGALSLNEVGIQNIAIGVDSARNTTDSFNTAVGHRSLNSNTIGQSNTALGHQALMGNKEGSNNVAIGASALYGNGYAPLELSTSNNVVVGSGAAASVSNGNSNVVIGTSALASCESTNSSTVVGAFAASQKTAGLDNNIFGFSAMQNSYTGSGNCAFGNYTLWSFTGDGATAFGNNSQRANITGVYNAAFGTDSLSSNTTGTHNTALGSYALYGASFPSQNISYNTAVGTFALYQITTGTHNTALGTHAGLHLTSGRGNLIVGPLSSVNSHTPVYDVTTQDNRISMGSTGATNAYVQVAWTVVSDARDKTDFAPVPHGLDFVCNLNPTAYRYKETREATEGHGPLRYGFKAQDVLALEGDTPVIVDAEDMEKLRFNDQALIAVLVNAIKELKAEIDILKAAK